MNKNDSLVITKRQTSFISAGLILLFACFFILGYVIGQRKALNEFNERLQDESFADRVRYSLYSSYGNSPVVESEQLNDSDLDSQEPEADVELDLQEPKSNPRVEENSKKYYAELFGCGNLKTAQAFIDRSRKLGIEILVKERKSKGPKGKIIRWYQLLTKEYANKEEFEKVLDIIKNSEKLQQIKIVEV